MGISPIVGHIFSTDGFVPRADCGDWPDWLQAVWHLGNGLYVAAYLAIPAIILFARRPARNNVLDQPWIGLWFAGFIFLCGGSHLWEMVVFVYPGYRFFALWNLVGGVVSCGAVGALWSWLRQVALLPSRKMLHDALNEAHAHAVQAAETRASQDRLIENQMRHIRRLEDMRRTGLWQRDAEATLETMRADLHAASNGGK